MRGCREAAALALRAIAAFASGAVASAPRSTVASAPRSTVASAAAARGGRRRAGRGRGHHRGAQRLGERPGVRVAVLRALRERLLHHRVDRLGQLDIERRRRQRVLLQYLLHRRRRRAGERPLSGEELVEDHAGGEEVRAAVHRQPLDLLGRHEARRAHHAAHLREARRLDVGDAEVGDLHRAVLEQEDVAGLDVAVDHALPVRVAERVEDLRHDAHDLGVGEALVPLECGLEVAPLDVLHRDERGAVVLVEVVDRDDVGVVEPAGGLRLAAEARDDRRRVLAGQLVAADRLQRHPALDHRVVRLVDDAHRAAPERAPDLVPAEPVVRRHARVSLASPEKAAPAAKPAPSLLRRPAATCTCCRSPTPTSAPAAAPSCRGRRRPAATATRRARPGASRRSPSSPRCSPSRPARWSRR